MKADDTPETAPRRSLWPYGIIISLSLVVVWLLSFVVFASSQMPVLESETAYADSLEYDRIMADRAASAALGWRVDVDVMDDAVVYRITDAEGRPVRGLSGTLRMARPDTQAADAEVEFAEQAPGVYRAPRGGIGGVFRLAARLEGGPEAFVDERKAVFR